jgi:hypothetical protein
MGMPRVPRAPVQTLKNAAINHMIEFVGRIPGRNSGRIALHYFGMVSGRDSVF